MTAIPRGEDGREATVKMTPRILALGLALWMLLSAAALAADDGFSKVYTYDYDYWGELRQSPNAYRADEVIFSATLGLETPMKKPQSLFAQGCDLYVCDTGNNRILQLVRDGENFRLERIIDAVEGADPAGFDAPNDVFVNEAGEIYVADTNHNRVVMMDRDLRFIRQYVKPLDSTFDQNLSFLPNKIAVDTAGRVYVLSTNVNKGLVKYEADGTFSGFIGANRVKYDLWAYIWKAFLSTREQRAQQASFVPTEYENICIDKEGFIYATNTVFNDYDLKSGDARPIRRLNGIGDDILIRNGHDAPIGDLQWVNGSLDNGPSKFKDITVLDNDIYVAVDRTHGRLFGYDAQGILLWAFGNKGNHVGAFLSAVSVEHMGYDLIVLDEDECSITVFTPTDYGALIYRANDEYLRGQYDTSADTWREVLKLNANYDPAFIGVGRALLRKEQYAEAMKYFKMAHDRVNYGRAYRYYRKEAAEKSIGWIIAAVAALLIVPLVVQWFKKMKMEVEADERRKAAGFKP